MRYRFYIKARTLVLLVLLVLTISSVGKAERYVDLTVDSELIEERILADKENLVTCYVRSCGLKFLCNPNWHMKIIDENSTLITISQEPYVTLAISRIDADVKYLGQLSNEFFEGKNLYLDNFRKDYADFAGTNAIELKAFSLMEPDMRYLGYFYFNEKKLYSVFFAIYPKDYWDKYQFLIREVRQSFQII